jgi:hypothetical protein
MELHELRKCIDSAICTCQELICKNPNLVLSEGDFEKLLCKCITDVLNYDPLKPDDSFSVHTQISHYMDGKVHSDKRVDILLLQESKLRYCTKAKNYQYFDDSFALELKYFHEKDDVRKVRCDFCKRRDLDANSWLYIVVLLDCTEEKKHLLEEKKNKIEQYAQELYNMNTEYNENLFFQVLIKKIQNNNKQSK